MILTEYNFFLESQEAESLEEAGGLLSWLKRAYTGMDTDLIDELRSDIKGKRTSTTRCTTSTSSLPRVRN